MLNSLIYSNRATPYRAKSGLVQRPTSAIRRTAIEWHILLRIGRSVMIAFMVSTR